MVRMSLIFPFWAIVQFGWICVTQGLEWQDGPCVFGMSVWYVIEVRGREERGWCFHVFGISALFPAGVINQKG